MNTQKLDVWALAIAIGCVWAAAILVLGLGARLFGWGLPMVNLFRSLYLGYGPTFTGTAIGTLWAFVAICGALVAWIYNCVARRGAEAPRV
jgi:hypothetical protein